MTSGRGRWTRRPVSLDSLRVRVVLGGVSSAIVTLVVVWVTAWAAGRLWMENPPVAAAVVARCEAGPATWSEGMLDVASAFAYDPHGVSANPAAPALSAEMIAALRAGGRAQAWEGDERVVLVPGAAEGPCAVFRVGFRPPSNPWNGLLVGVGTGAVAAILLVAWLSYRFAVVPLVRRIHHLRDGARQIGADAYTGSADPVPDALGEIGAALDRSHARIRSDRDELVARHRALEDHLAEIAHDLRTPLASLLLAVQEVEQAVRDPDAREAITRALGDTAYLTALVENLHQATRLRQGLDATDGEADLREIVERLGVRFAAIGRHEAIEVAASTPDHAVPVRCAAALAERAIANLVHNAVAHGEPGGHVALILEAGVRFQLVVLDDGPGLPEPALADLAARTFSHDPARPRTAGLGLAITNEVARRVGWEIRYEPAEPHGLRVTITGPVATRRPPPGSPSGGRPRRSPDHAPDA